MGAPRGNREVAKFGATSFFRRAVGIGLAVGFASVGVAPIAAAFGVVSTEIHVSIDGMNFYRPDTYVVFEDITEVVLSPAPRVRVHKDGTGFSYASVSYPFRIEGPVGGTPVPIEIDGTLEIDANDVPLQSPPLWGVSASVSAFTYDSTFDKTYDPNILSTESAAVECRTDSCPAAHQQQHFILSLNSLTGADNAILLFASAQKDDSPASTFDARIIDPIIRFAPGFDATGYRILVGDGVGNGGVVPEPGAAMLIGGGLMILARRGRVNVHSS